VKYQPPAYSPLTLGAIARSIGAALMSAERARAQLRGSLTSRFGADSAILTRSGTHALQVALESIQRSGAGPATVALPGYSCFDLVTASVGAGVNVRFYDVDPTTLSPDLGSLRRVIRDGVSAVVASNLYGYPLDWPSLAAECAAASVTLIEDAAQGVGTATPAGNGGTLGVATVLSFGRGKGWTGGGGGALLLRSPLVDSPEVWTPRLAPGGLGVRSSVITLAAWGLGRPSLYRIPASAPGLGLGETHYHEPTHVAAMPAFSAALARRTSGIAKEAPETRREVAHLWERALEQVGPDRSGLRVCKPLGGSQAGTYLRFPVVAASSERADTLVKLGQDLGIAEGYPTPLPQLHQSTAIRLEDQATPGSAKLAECLITLPTHRWIDASVISKFIDRLS
jgi:dTDP-4-amino-4,6-dideoxygalactose transaminase